MRYGALASKPALMWLLVAWGRSVEAAALGSLMLVASLVGMAMSNEAHLQLYAAIFGRTRSHSGLYRLLSHYVHSIITHIVLIAIPAIVTCAWLFPKVNPLLAVGLALAERVSDELLRIKLYRKEWTHWTILLLAKNFAPALPALVGIFWLGGPDICYTLGALVFSTWLLSLEGRPVWKAIGRASQNLTKLKYLRSHLSSYIRVLAARQVAAILSLNVVLLDRYVGMNLWNTKYVAYLVLAGQIVNGVFFVVEAKHLSEHRANFIDSNSRLSVFWEWKPYIYMIVACMISAGMIFLIGTRIGILPHMPSNLYGAVVFLIANYAIFYLSMPFNDYLYYRGQAKPIAVGHASIFITYSALVVSIVVLQQPEVSLALLTAILACRAALLNMAWKRFDKHHYSGATRL